MSYNARKKPVIAVVGAGPGIGEAVARRFADEGYVVALLARTEDKLRIMAHGIDAELGEAGGDATAFTDESWACHRVGCGCGILFPVLEGRVMQI
jgi:NADP-dependent 3-hydroxy acid dehydrogenase YdfG